MTPSFPHHLATAIFESAVALFEHLPPILAAAVFFAAVVAVVAVLVAVPWQTARLVVRVWRWFRGRALAGLNREYAALCAASAAAPPQVRRAVGRRMAGMRIRRRVRHTTSSSDRRTRS